jgi:hypothetical protein
MLTLPPGVRVFVATERVDGRKGIDGLSVLVRSQFAEDPLSGTMFVFFSRRADRVRLLYWDRDVTVRAMTYAPDLVAGEAYSSKVVEFAASVARAHRSGSRSA